MVRGLDYYTRTTFELITTQLGAQGAVAAGGRYDGLVKQLGGPEVPGIGFAMGLERLVMLLSQQEHGGISHEPDLFIVALGKAPYTRGFLLMQNLRTQGLRIMMDHENRSMKNQLKQADRQKARFVLILGERELADNEAVLKEMQSGEQQQLEILADSGAWAAAVKEKISSRIS